MQILLWRTLQNLDYRWEENYIMLSFFFFQCSHLFSIIPLYLAFSQLLCFTNLSDDPMWWSVKMSCEMEGGLEVGPRESSDKISELQTSESCTSVEWMYKTCLYNESFESVGFNGLTNPCKIRHISLCLLWQLRKIKEIYKSCLFVFLQIMVLTILYGM